MVIEDILGVSREYFFACYWSFTAGYIISGLVMIAEKLFRGSR